MREGDPVLPQGSETCNRKLWITIVAVAVASIVIISVVAFSFVPPRPSVPRIVSVSASPNPGVPDEFLTVDVVAESDAGHPSVGLSYIAFLSSDAKGGGSMPRVGGNHYSMRIGPFRNGTEVWLVVTAADSGGLVVDSAHSVMVGNVIRGGPSGLDVRGVGHLPSQPTVRDTVVVNATVTGSSNITDVTLLYTSIQKTSEGSGSRAMERASSTEYSVEIDDVFLFGYIYEKGTVFIYRVVAVDETANTAASEAESFTWS